MLQQSPAVSFSDTFGNAVIPAVTVEKLENPERSSNAVWFDYKQAVVDVILWAVLVICCCSSANKCLLKVAQFSAQRELFERAAEIYEQVSFFSGCTCMIQYNIIFYMFILWSLLPFAAGAGIWLLILKLQHNIYILLVWISNISASFCVTWLWTWKKIHMWRSNFFPQISVEFDAYVEVDSDARWFVRWPAPRSRSCDLEGWKFCDIQKSSTRSRQSLPHRANFLHCLFDMHLV